MRVGLIVDSACDLPYEFSRKHNLFVLPVTAVIDGQTYIDEHEPVRTQEFYQSGLLQKGHHAETHAFSAEQIHSMAWTISSAMPARRIGMKKCRRLREPSVSWLPYFSSRPGA